jgi:hypothetical protein
VLVQIAKKWNYKNKCVNGGYFVAMATQNLRTDNDIAYEQVFVYTAG